MIALSHPLFSVFGMAPPSHTALTNTARASPSVTVQVGHVISERAFSVLHIAKAFN